MSIRKTIFTVAALCCMLQVSVFATAYGNKNQVNISGATLFATFFAAPAGTNDWIGVDQGLDYAASVGPRLYTDGDFLMGYDPFNPNLPDQLAFGDWTSNDPNNRWVVQSRGVGSGTGLKELDLFYNFPPPGPGDPTFVLPNDKSYINRTQWGFSGGLMGPGNPANPGGCVVVPPRIDMAVMDVPTRWLVVAGASANAYWQAHPLDAADGYGQDPLTSWDTGQSNKLKTLTNLNLNSIPNALTIVDSPVAWVPIAFIANQGTGLQNVTQNDLQYLYLTGRMPGGENLYACTRDSGSGTRDAAMNSIAVDPSWGRGDNMGTKNSNGNVSYPGPIHQPTNLDGTSVMANAVTNQRLAVGYVGLTTANTQTGASNAAYQILNLKKTGGKQYVRPSLTDTVDNADINTGWQVGGNETFATVGSPDPNAAFVMPYNRYARDYLWNIEQSVAQFIAPTTNDDQNNMPGQYLARNWSLAAALQAIPQDSAPSVFVTNPNYNANVNAYYKANGPITPAWVDGPGKVPTRVVGPTYSDGTNGANYIFSDGVARPNGGNLNTRNQIMGDFDGDGKRDIGDIPAMMVAFSNPRGFETANGGTGVCPEIIGDFTADGNFTADDIRYFADGLAVVDPVSRQVNRSVGFALVDQSWTAALAALVPSHPTAGNFFNTTLAHGTYQYGSGWSKADIATHNWRTTKPTIGAAPSADGVIDACDIDYLYFIMRGGLKAQAFGQTLPANCNAWQNSMRWSNLDDAVWMDLSCDLNGDGVVDIQDVRTIVQTILGTHFGDANLDGVVDATDIAIVNAHLGQQGGWAQGDFDGDGWVTECDLEIALAAQSGQYGPIENAQISSGSADLNGDGIVNFEDFAIFANQWLQTTN
ncbi:MAG: dockerin type I domain-containing protein [Sedimentisphaerales bacterium]